MARIRKIPDTWTFEIHAIVLKDSRQTEHEEIGYTDTTGRSSVYSNIKCGGRGAQNEKKCSKTTRHDKTKLSVLKHQTWWERSSKLKETLENNKTEQDEAQYTRTSNVVGEELKAKRTARNNKKRQDEAQYTRTSNVVREELKKRKESLENNKTRQDEAQYTRTSNVVGEELKTKRNA